MLETYLSLGGQEIGNNARVERYMQPGLSRSLNGCACPDFAAALGHEPYVSPAADPAPWYDPNEPESAGFGGLWIETIDGLHDAAFNLSPVQRLGDGAIVPPRRHRDRVLTVTGWLFATDMCSADWGLRWLTARLLGCVSCEGADLCLLRCCPTDADDVQRQLRTLKNASLISGPEVIGRAPLPEAVCEGKTRPAFQVTFQISADPAFWRQPVTVIDELVWPEPDPDTQLCNIIWDTSGDCDPDNPDCIPGVNSPLRGCTANPFCPPPPPPPRVPTATTGCVCVPLYVVRQCADIPAAAFAPQFVSALRMRLYAGDDPIRNLSITIYQNPRQLPAEELDDCRACGTYYVEYVPPDSTLVIDGTTSSARMLCPGGVNTAGDSVLFGDGGGPAQHIQLQCGMHYTVCADMDVESFSPLATLSLETVTREM